MSEIIIYTLTIDSKYNSAILTVAFGTEDEAHAALRAFTSDFVGGNEMPPDDGILDFLTENGCEIYFEQHKIKHMCTSPDPDPGDTYTGPTFREEDS